jgi:hypothetical protein
MSEDKHECIQKSVIDTLCKQQSEIHAAVCGDIKPGTAPGILTRIDALELKFKIAIGVASSSIVIAGVVALVRVVAAAMIKTA